MTMTDNGHTIQLPELPWSPNPRNKRLLDSLAYTQDQDDADLNRTLERALLLLRDEMLNGPTVVVADAPKRGGRKAK